MKKKTLLVLLVVGLVLAIAFFVFLLIQSVGYFRAYGVYLNTYQESQASNNASWYDFSGKRITASEWISLMTMHYLIKPLLFLLGSFSLAFILLYITIGIARRE